jgi:crossover junction endodeoxyribonuclease RuvC
MRYIGIDPGKSGTIAWIDADGACSFTKKLGDLTERDIRNALTEITNACAVLEKVSSSPQMGVVSAFTFGKGYGTLLGILAGANIPYVEVSPQKWQAALGCRTKGDKNVSKRKAEQLFPATKITHANADALLLAKYCQQNHSSLF